MMMDRRETAPNGYDGLIRVIRQVRRRWRLKRTLQGVSILATALLLTVLLAVVALEHVSVEPGTVAVARVVILITALGIAVRVLLPITRRVPDEQIALYLEEHEPSLRAALITALTSGSSDAEVSPAFARRTIETALERCREIQYGERIERRYLSRSTATIAGVLGTAVLLYLVAPPAFQTAARSLILPFQPAEAATPSLVLVEPGNASLPRGSDLPITAVLSGFSSRDVDLMSRTEGDSAFVRLPMMASEDGSGFELRLFSLDRALDYYVESEGIRSPIYRATVLDVPYVQRLEVDLEFPAYTGLAPRRIEEGGDIAAPSGTIARRSPSPAAGSA
jgi:hypothetical protein